MSSSPVQSLGPGVSGLWAAVSVLSSVAGVAGCPFPSRCFFITLCLFLPRRVHKAPWDPQDQLEPVESQ